jgi:transposase
MRNLVENVPQKSTFFYLVHSVILIIFYVFRYPSKSKMARKLNNEARQLIINAYNNQRSIQEIAELFNCSTKTVHRIVKAYQVEGRVEAKPQGGNRPKKISDEHRSAIRSYVAEDCSISLEKIARRLLEEFGVEVCKMTVYRALRSFSYSFKRVSLIPERRNDKETLEVRCTYAREFLSLLSQRNGENIFFLDELGFNISMRARRGWDGPQKGKVPRAQSLI